MLQSDYTFEDLKMSSQLVRDLIANHENLSNLIERPFDLGNVLEQIETNQFGTADRLKLVESLRRQNTDIKLSEKTTQHIDLLLSENTFTVTAGHQLNLLTGPLYSIYKISQSIALCRDLADKYPNYNFVPIFWMATEDHDFEEINHLHLFGKKLSWNKEGQENVIVGRINTQGIEDFLSEVEGLFQDPVALESVKKFTDCYRSTSNLADANRLLLNSLMGEFGLVIIDGDDAGLKEEFKEVMVKEVSDAVGFKQVMATNSILESLNYHEQVHVRECNLFYIDEQNVRQRIVAENGSFEINGKTKSKEELILEIQAHPERFSPNALYRPLYQEKILPNVAFIGGGGEIAYWLQLKTLFEKQGVVFPMLLLRDSFLLYTTAQAELLSKLDLELMDLKLGVDQIVKDLAIQNSEMDLQLTDAEAELFKIKSMIMAKVHKVSTGLETMVDAEFAKMIKSIEKIEAKLIKAEKAKHDQTQNKLVKVRNAFFPESGFQERHDNFLPYYLKDENFVAKILGNFESSNEPRIRLIEI